MKVRGGCHCGTIQYEAEVEPGTISICHCTDCQMQSGSVFRCNIPASASTFKMIQGSPRRYIKVADSGARRVHAFCEHCGTPVYACDVDDPQTYSLRVGALSQRFELGLPKRQIWAKRRFAWLNDLDDVTSVNGQPE